VRVSVDDGSVANIREGNTLGVRRSLQVQGREFTVVAEFE
jgi:hypothetical protein